MEYALNSLRGKSGLTRFCCGRTLKRRFQKGGKRRGELMGTGSHNPIRVNKDKNKYNYLKNSLTFNRLCINVQTRNKPNLPRGGDGKPRVSMSARRQPGCLRNEAVRLFFSASQPWTSGGRRGSQHCRWARKCFLVTGIFRWNLGQATLSAVAHSNRPCRDSCESFEKSGCEGHFFKNINEYFKVLTLCSLFLTR